MKFRIKFVHGLEVEYEAETMHDDGLALTLLNTEGEIVIKYMDSDIRSCEAITSNTTTTLIETGDTYSIHKQNGHRLYDVDGQMIAAYRTLQAAKDS